MLRYVSHSEFRASKRVNGFSSGSSFRSREYSHNYYSNSTYIEMALWISKYTQKIRREIYCQFQKSERKLWGPEYMRNPRIIDMKFAGEK